MSYRISACILFLLVGLLTPLGAHAANDFWDGNGAMPPNNNWNFALSWVDNTTPGNSDTATFNIASTYTVSFSVSNPDAIEALTISSGNPTFASTSATGRTLRVNSASGTQDIVVTGASTSLTLGESPSNEVNLIAGDDLSVQNDAVLTAQFDSNITAADLSNAGLNGTIVMDGPGATLTLNAIGANNFIGRSGNSGTLAFLAGSTGNSIAGNLGIADSGTANSEGFVPVQGGSMVSLTGNLTMANQDVPGQIAALGIDGTGSSLTQTGASTITVGADTNGTATIEIGVSADGGTLTTGTGLFTINPTGTITIGNSGNNNEGTLNANGDVVVNGGVLRRNRGTFTVAAAETMTVQNGGLFDVRGFYNADATFVVTGAGSAWNSNSSVSIGAVGTGALTVSGGGALSDTSGNVGTAAGSNGTVTVTGTDSSWANSAALSVGSSGTGALTIAAGGEVTDTNGSIGAAATGSGTVTVTGTGSTWTNSGELRVGGLGMGALTVEAGGDVTNTFGYIGADALSNGTVIVRGTGSTWTNSMDLIVGRNGTGRLTIANGADVVNVFGYLGDDFDGDGTVMVSGTGSTWINTASLVVGNFGDATLMIENGADVSSSGTGAFIGTQAGTSTATVRGAGSTWTNVDLTVGFFGTATLAIIEGGAVFNGEGFVGQRPGSNGRVTVSGSGSIWNNTTQLRIGPQGTGILTIESGADVINGSFGSIGETTGGNGTLTVTGTGSTWTTGSLRVAGNASGPGGTGALDVQSGGRVDVGGNTLVWDNGSVDLETGGRLNSGSIQIQGGDVNVSGGTLETLLGSVIVQDAGILHVSNVGSVLSATLLDIGISDGAGTLIVDGASSSAASAAAGLNSWALNGHAATATFSHGASGSFPGGITLAGSAAAGTTAHVDILSGADLLVGNLALATLGGATTSAAVTVDGAGSSVTQSGSSTITIGHSATGSASLVVRNNASFTSGTGQILVENTGSIEINSGALFDARGTITMSGGDFDLLGGTLHVDNFDGDLVTQGGTLAPGHSAGTTRVVGAYKQLAGGTLQIEIGGTTAGTQFDTLNVGGESTLAGTLAVALINSFAPAAGDRFQFLRSGGVINGTFATELLPALAGGLFFDVVYTANSVVLLTAGVLGDYNRNGVVDAGDYVIWRNGLGQTGSGLAADGNNNGVIDNGDYNVWRSNFGQMAGSGAALPSAESLSAAVPEPATVVLLIFATVGALIRRKRGPLRLPKLDYP